MIALLRSAVSTLVIALFGVSLLLESVDHSVRNQAVSLVCKSGNNSIGAELLSIVSRHIEGNIYVL